MNLINSEIKRILNKKSFVIIFCIFLILSLLAIVKYKDGIKVDYSVEISVLDEDNSLRSKEFIEKLNANSAIKIVENKENSVEYLETMIKKSEINAGIVIPKNFFENLPDSKMELIYSDLDVLAPALIDIISQDFINDVCERTMYNKIKNQYSEKEADKAVKEFTDLKKESFFDLEVIKEPYNALSGLKSKASIDEINGLRTIFMYVITFNLLFVGLSLQLFRQESRHLISRMQVANKANRRYYISSSVVFSMLLITIPLLSCISIAFLLDMKFSYLLFLIFSCLVCSLFIYSIMTLLTSLIKEENIAFSLNVILIIFLSMVGGAFFSIDIMPEEVIKIVSKSPFYLISETFYETVDGNIESIFTTLFYLLLSLGIFSLNLKRFSTKR